MKHESRKKLPRFKKIKKWRWIAFWIDSVFPLRTSIQKRWSFLLQMYWEKRLPPIRGFWVAVFKANQISGVSSLEISVFFLVKDIGNLISLSWRPLFTLMTTSSTLPKISDKNPQNSSWHSFTHPSINWNLNSWRIYHFQRCTYH